MRLTVIASLLLAAAPLVSTSPLLAADTAASAATLSVTFTGLEATKGAIMLAVYDAEGWTGGKPVRVAMIDAAGKDLSTSFTGLAPGRYGIKAFHDLDGDGKMTVNPFGMPTEPFAFSNDAHGEHGPASWDAASFDVTAAGAQQRITIR